MPLQEGKTILDKYRIIKLLGEGGMANVWLAEEVAFGKRQVAIKEPRQDLLPGNQEELQRRYQQEMRLTSRLMQARVPNIVPAWTVEPYEGGFLLVMAYMAGGSLETLLRMNPKGLPIDRTLEITRSLLDALGGLHSLPEEPVHRDIKPANALLDEVGVAHLADFGLAELPGMSGRSQLSGRPHPGSPLYSAPEQLARPDPLTPAADLYALGCVLFEMLTGKRYKRMEPGTTAKSLRSEAPEWLDNVLLKALQENPWRRYQHTQEMAEALLQGESEFAQEASRRQEQDRLIAEEQRQVEERMQREAKERIQAEEQTLREGAERQQVEERAREANERERSLEQARLGNEDKARRITEERKRAEEQVHGAIAQDAVRQQAEERARREAADRRQADERSRREAAERTRRETEERRQAEEQARREAAEVTQRQIEEAEKARLERDRIAAAAATRQTAAQDAANEAGRQQSLVSQIPPSKRLVARQLAAQAIASERRRQQTLEARTAPTSLPVTSRMKEKFKVTRRGFLITSGLVAASGLLGYVGWYTILRPLTVPQANPLILTLADGVSMSLVRVPAGEFTMGSFDTDPGAQSNEKPPHTVFLDEYLISTTEVTVAQFRAFITAAAYTSDYSASNPVIPSGKDDYPINPVSWNDALAFCVWASQVTGRDVHLPTEAQWEKAARGTDGRIYSWGNDPADSSRSNYYIDVGDTTSVGTYSPSGDSPYGCKDMAGNVWEWVNDSYQSDYYSVSPGSNPTGPVSGIYRVLRGGSWGSTVGSIRAANRGSDDPDLRINAIGFRCAVSPR